MKSTQWMLVLSTIILSLALATGCKKKTEVTDSGDIKPTPMATPGTGEEDPAAGTGLPDPAEVETMVLERVHFGFDQSMLSAEAKEVLGRNANILRENPTVKIRIEGHCDERGSTEYNLALGERRATAVRDYLRTLGVPAANLVVVSMGKEKPIQPGSSEEAYAANRRAESVVIEGSDNVLGSAK